MCAGPWISALHGEVLVTFQQGSRSDQRHQPEMALYVPENQAPSVFSNPGSFGCVMQAKLVIERRQSFQFDLRGTGQANLTLNDQDTLGGMDQASEPMTLSPGTHVIQVRYTSPTQGDAQLRVYWKGEDFPWEPLTGGHLQSTESAKDDALRSVRHQMAHLKCAACHLPQQAVSMPDALEKGPSLDGVGSRLQPAWMAQWIADPQLLRPQTHMPQVFRGKEGLQKAAHIAAFLSQQRAPIRRLGQGDATRGGHLFQALNCIGCHALEGEAPARISLERVHQKYQPGALAAYLQNPALHYPDTAMPSFELSSTEARDLASFLRSLDPHPDAKADLPIGDPSQGKTLLASSGCLQCHALDGVDSTFSAPGLDQALRSNKGCLDPEAKPSPAPHFAQPPLVGELSNEDRQRLITSLTHFVPTEYAERTIKGLQCTACHARFDEVAGVDALQESVKHLKAIPAPQQDGEGAGQPPQRIPSLTHAGHKLQAPWVADLIAGEVLESTRPWLEARMPAWPSRAQHLAQGLAHGSGLSSVAQTHTPGTEAQKEMGELLVGAKGFSCNACHAVGDEPALSVFEGAGPNLKLVSSRLREGYYFDWMHFPQRWMPDTIMPRYAENNQSPLESYAGGQADLQYAALLEYFHDLADRQPPGMAPGLVGAYYSVRRDWQRTLSRLDGSRPFLLRKDDRIEFPNGAETFSDTKLTDAFMVRWTGMLRVPISGKYMIHVQSDDGARLRLDGEIQLDELGPHSFAEETVTLDLDAGLHPFELIYHEIGGGQGCVVSWTRPGSRREVIPATNWLHRPKDLDAIQWNPEAWASYRVGTRETQGGGNARSSQEVLDAKYGSLIGTAVRVANDDRGENVAFRGQVVRLDESGRAAIVFDTDTMRMAAAWLDGGLRLEGLPFTGGHGAFPNLRVEPLIRNRAAPGWAQAGGSFEEPRQTSYPPLGPLPKSWAHYEGLYRHEDRVIFAYTVGSTRVLEYPSLIETGNTRVISRLLEIQAHDEPLWVTVADLTASLESIHEQEWLLGGARIGLGQAPTQTQWVQEGGQLRLQLPPATRAYQVEVVFSKRDEPLPSNLPRRDQSLQEWTHGGSVRWPEVLVTRGELASEDAEAAYVLDRLTLPDNNPYGFELRIGGFDFFSDPTTAAICTWDGDVWIVSGIDADLDTLEWKRFASGIHEPLGLKIVEDRIYTVSDDQITRFHDFNEDGEADFYENFNNDWELTSGFHAFLFDLHTDPEGNFLFAFGSPVRGGGRSFERMSAHHGSVLKVSADGSTLTRYASGLRAPNGIGVSPDGQVTTGDNEGTFVPRCPINWVEPDDFLGVVDSYENRDRLRTTATVEERRCGREPAWDRSEEPKPLAWLPKGVDNSGGGQAWVTSDRWGPLQGQMLHGSYGQSSLYVVLKEKVESQMQGGVVKLPLRPTSSVMRMRFNQGDGQLYLSGLKGWQSNAGRNGGLDRVRYTGKPLAMPNELHVTPEGLRVSFTQALDPGQAQDIERFSLRASDILWDQAYGSAEFLLGQRELAPDQKQTGWSSFSILKSELLEDGRSIHLTIEDWQPAHMLELNVDVTTLAGQPIRTQIHHTVHVIPESGKDL